MSTTVSYKGITIATVNNETKTLNTAGTWVEGDITLVDNSTVDYSVTYSMMGGAYATATPAKALAGEGFTSKIKVPAGYILQSISVTMGGVDITSQVVEYDEDSGGGGSLTLQSKSVSYTPTTSAQSETVTADSGYDGLSTVAVSIEAIPSEYVIPSGTLSIASNGTHDVTNYASVSVNVPVSSGANIKTGTYIPASTYNTTGNRLIVSIADIGFTPTKFYLFAADYTDINTIQYSVLRASYEQLGDDDSLYYFRATTRYSNTSGTLGTSNNGTSWTNQTNYYLYCDGSNVYLRTTNTFILPANVTYMWVAVE